MEKRQGYGWRLINNMVKIASKNKRTPQPKAKRQNRPGSSMVVSTDSEHHSTLVGLIDPFSPEALTAKVPDIGAGATMTEQVRFAATITSDASGLAYFAVVPKVDYPLLEDVAGAWAAAYSNAVNSTSLVLGYGQLARITSYGLRFVSLLSATDAKGAIRLCTGPAPVLSAAVVTSPDAYTEYDLHGIADDTEFHMVGKPDGAESLDWSLVSNIDGNLDSPAEGWMCLYVLATGLPVSTACLQLEIVVNVEFKPLPGLTINKLCTPQPVYDPQMLVARNHAHNNIKNVVKGAGHALNGHIKKEAHKAIVKHVLPFLQKKGSKALASLLV